MALGSLRDRGSQDFGVAVDGNRHDHRTPVQRSLDLVRGNLSEVCLALLIRVIETVLCSVVLFPKCSLFHRRQRNRVQILVDLFDRSVEVRDRESFETVDFGQQLFVISREL